MIEHYLTSEIGALTISLTALSLVVLWQAWTIRRLTDWAGRAINAQHAFTKDVAEAAGITVLVDPPEPPKLRLVKS
jgi:hypothetical protein